MFHKSEAEKEAQTRDYMKTRFEDTKAEVTGGGGRDRRFGLCHTNKGESLEASAL